MTDHRTDWLSFSTEIPNRVDFARFLIALAEDLRKNPETWERVDLESYLRAMAHWAMNSMEAVYQHGGLLRTSLLPGEPSRISPACLRRRCARRPGTRSGRPSKVAPPRETLIPRSHLRNNLGNTGQRIYIVDT
jgi:hypothetical protein